MFRQPVGKKKRTHRLNFLGCRAEGTGFRFRPALEYLEDRILLSATGSNSVPLYLPPQHNLFDYSGYLTAPSAATPVMIAESYLRSHASDLGILPADLDNYIVTTNYLTEGTGATTLTFAQSLHGMEVANANFNITVAADGRLLNVGGGFVPGLSQRAQGQFPSFGYGSVQAVVSAAGTLGLTLPQDPIVVAGQPNGPATLSARSLSLDDIPAKLRYVAIAGNDVSLAWNLTVRTPDSSHWYSIDVDANTGGLVSLVDYASLASYEVIAIPNQNIDESPRTIQTDPHLITPVPTIVPSPFGWHDTNGAVGPEFTITQGNNVNAYADRDSDDQPDAGSQPDGGAELNFTGALVPLDLTKAPSEYTAAAVTNLFYWSNILHDVLYLYGFDEAARNFQVNNYGRGGIGGDAVNAEAQDGSGTNNANFLTPPDGTAPRMQMFEFTLTNPRRDGDFEPSIIVHEYGHGVSNRLTGNSNGLRAIQSRGMGEGWSDWWSLMFTQKTANETTIGRGVGTYVLGEPLNGPGVRDFKYDFDIANLNLETFLNFGTDPGQSTQVHDAGTRWSAALWDLNHLLIRKYGFEPNIYNSTSSAGNIRAMQLVINALKIQPLNPSFIEARDAILLADILLSGGANQLEIWTAFARRGLGEFASTPSSNAPFLTTSFVIPPEVQLRISIGPDVTKLEGDLGTTDFVFSVNFAGTLFDQPATVVYATVGNTATAESDFIAQSGTVTFLAGGPTTQAFTIKVVGDTLSELNETFLVRLSNATNAVLNRSEAVGTILNDDIDLFIGDASVIEGASGTNHAVFTVFAQGTVNQEISVSYVTADGTAKASSDYLPRSGVVSFAPGTVTVNISVPILDDALNEGTENFFVDLSNVVHARIARSRGVGTILDNDLQPSLYVNDVHVTTTQPGVLAAVFTIALGTPSGQDVTVQYATADGSAQAGLDYVPQNGLISFAPGTTTKLVTVPILNNATYAPNEKFYLNLSNPVHAALADGQGVGTIIFADPLTTEFIKDDGDPGYTQTAGWTNLTNTLAYQLDYNFHAPGSGTGTATWTFGNLPSGAYQVFTRWVPFSNRATNAPFTVLDGPNALGTVLVNQQQFPTGDQANGITWQSLGLFQASTGTLAVRLSDNANGYVIADAIRIVADGIPPQVPEMDVAGYDRSIANGATAPSFDDATDFGSIVSTTGSTTHAFTITNTGNAPLHLSGSPAVEITGANPQDFTVVSQPATTIAAGASTTFQVMFHPTTTGPRLAILSIANDDGSEHPYTFEVQGTGLAAGPSQWIIDDSMAGFQAIGNWTTNPNTQAYSGQFHASAAGQGADHGTWTLTGLAPGLYQVFTTWAPFGNRATNAPFTIADGAVSQNTVFVNQRQSPNDLVSDGVIWSSLTTLSVTTGMLTVSLNNQANGFVAADAVRIVRVDLPLAVPIVAAHNGAMPLDVNGDTRISSLDALLVINKLNAQSVVTAAPSATPLAASATSGNAASPNYFVDVNGDGIVSPRDALMVINYLLHPPSATTSAGPAAGPLAAPAASLPSAIPAAAVDQAISQWGGAPPPDAGTPATPAIAVSTSIATRIAPSATASPLTPPRVRAFFASSAKKSVSPSGSELASLFEI